MKFTPGLLIFVMLVSACTPNKNQAKFESNWHVQNNRQWIGPEYFAENINNWEINKGKLTCLNKENALAELHILPVLFKNDSGNVSIRMKVNVTATQASPGSQLYAGIKIWNQPTGQKTSGFIFGINNKKQLFIANNEPSQLLAHATLKNLPDTGLLTLKINIDASNTVQLQYHQTSVSYNLPESAGKYCSIICVSNNNHTPVSFSGLLINGSKTQIDNSRNFGPIISTLNGVNINKRKMAVHFAPVSPQDPDTFIIEFKEPDSIVWRTQKQVKIDKNKWYNIISLDFLNPGKQYQYRIIYQLPYKKDIQKKYFYQGLLPSALNNTDTVQFITLAGNAYPETTSELISGNQLNNKFNKALNNLKPAAILFTGNFTGEYHINGHKNYTVNDFRNSWLKFCYNYQLALKNNFSILIPGTKEYLQKKIWGEGRIQENTYPTDSVFPEQYENKSYQWHQQQGGFMASATYINYMENMYTAHLPYTPETDSNLAGIQSISGAVTISGIDFALLESFKFKTAPANTINKVEIYNGIPWKRWTPTSLLNNTEAQIIGSHQLTYTNKWAEHWGNCYFKVAIMHAPFYQLATYPDSLYYFTEYPYTSTINIPPQESTDILLKDLSSNGWPGHARDNIVQTLSKANIFSISGNSNIGSVVKYGISYNASGGVNFNTPYVSEANGYRWCPKKTGHDKPANNYHGDYLDGFRNRISVWQIEASHDTSFLKRFGLVSFNKSNGTISSICYLYTPGGIKNSMQHTISASDNGNTRARYNLPPLVFNNAPANNYVVTIKNNANNKINAVFRAFTDSIPLKVAEKTLYTIMVKNTETDSVLVFPEQRASWINYKHALYIK